MRPSDIKFKHEQMGRVLGENRYFFSRDTMKFFGDTMKSFGSRTIDGVTYLYRRPDAQVKTFTGRTTRAGRDFFNAWRFDQITGDLTLTSGREEQKVYDEVTS